MNVLSTMRTDLAVFMAMIARQFRGPASKHYGSKKRGLSAAGIRERRKRQRQARKIQRRFAK